MSIATYTIRTDSTTTTDPIYVGTANSSSATVSDDVWSIKRVTVSGDDFVVEWADGNGNPIEIVLDKEVGDVVSSDNESLAVINFSAETIYVNREKTYIFNDTTY